MCTLNAYFASGSGRKNECFVVKTGVPKILNSTNHPGFRGTPVKCGRKSNEEDPHVWQRDTYQSVPVTQNIRNTTRNCAMCDAKKTGRKVQVSV
jgi:hypothetical protein